MRMQIITQWTIPTNSWHQKVHQQLQQVTTQIAIQTIQRTIPGANWYHHVLTKKGMDLRNVTMHMLQNKMSKKKFKLKNLDQWKKRITLVVGDSTLAGLRESKLSRSKRIKVCYFPAGKT